MSKNLMGDNKIQHTKGFIEVTSNFVYRVNMLYV